MPSRSRTRNVRVSSSVGARNCGQTSNVSPTGLDAHLAAFVLASSQPNFRDRLEGSSARKEEPPSSHIGLINFTQQGIRNIKDYAATELARDFGIEIRDIFWTLGAFDGAVLIEAPDDQAVTARAFKLGSLGNVRTQTLRAFRANEFEKHPRKGPLTVGALEQMPKKISEWQRRANREKGRAAGGCGGWCAGG